MYRALDTRLDRSVAIKILPSHLSDDVIRRQRFEREAKVISSLNHPNICTLYDIGHQDGVDFIVMEYLEGVDLGTGQRTLFKEFAPADRTGLLPMREIFVTDDLKSYSYTAYYQVSSLFVSEHKQ